MGDGGGSVSTVVDAGSTTVVEIGTVVVAGSTVVVGGTAAVDGTAALTGVVVVVVVRATVVIAGTAVVIDTTVVVGTALVVTLVVAFAVAFVDSAKVAVGAVVSELPPHPETINKTVTATAYFLTVSVCHPSPEGGGGDIGAPRVDTRGSAKPVQTSRATVWSWSAYLPTS